jgi:hypothetical protein
VTKGPDFGSDPPQAGAHGNDEADTASFEMEHLTVTVAMDRGSKCTQELCLQIIPSKHGPGFDLPHEGVLLLNLGPGGSDGFAIFDFKGEDITELHVFEAEDRPDLDLKEKPSVTLGATQSPTQFIFHTWRYNFNWERKA